MICENCNKEHDGLYGSGRFCSSFCARSYSTKNSKNKTKSVYCIKCGKKIIVGNHATPSKCRCNECGIDNRKKQKGNLIKKKYNNKCKICGSELDDYGKCINNICKNIKLTYLQISILINNFNGDKSKIGTSEIFLEIEKIRKILYHLYWECGFSSIDIAKYFNYTKKHSIIQESFKYLNIPTRSLSLATRNAIFNGKLNNNIINRYISSWHKTWDGFDVFLRSSYEMDFAKELDNKKIHYEVETLKIKYFDTQKNIYRCAIPDFYIPSTNTIIEVKSYYTTDIKNLCDKENEYKKLGYNYYLMFEHEKFDSILNIDLNKYKLNIDENKIEIIRTYKQCNGFYWIYKNNIQKRCGKHELEKYLSDGWKRGRKSNM